MFQVVNSLSDFKYIVNGENRTGEKMRIATDDKTRAKAIYTQFLNGDYICGKWHKYDLVWIDEN